MRRTGLTAAVLWTALVAGVVASARAPAADEPPAAPSPPPAPAVQAPQRVILHLDRRTQVNGRIEHEDPDVVVVRDLDGRLHSMHKSRVLKIVRLIDPGSRQAGVVVLRNGDRQRGRIIEDAYDQVTVEIEGVRATLPRDAVDYVYLEPDVEQRYQHFRQRIKDGSPQQHYELCRWLVEQRRYAAARLELDELVKATQMPEAVELLRIVEAQLKLEAAKAGNPGARQADEPPGEFPRDAGDAEMLLPLITRQDVNLMRVYEIDFADPPRVAVGAETIRRLIDRYSTHEAMPTGAEARQALFRADPLDVVRLMFRLRARDLYGEIQVISEPRSLNLFRQRVHNTWLINGCATSGCHGGGHAGRFVLIRKDPRDDRARYTNLLILERLKLDEQWPLIDYQEPIRSLIVQYGLPRSEARKPHPSVRGWTPIFTKGNHRLLEDTIEWIGSMVRPRPQYPVDYEPQTGATAAADGSPAPNPAPPPESAQPPVEPDPGAAPAADPPDSGSRAASAANPARSPREPPPAPRSSGVGPPLERSRRPGRPRRRMKSGRHDLPLIH